MDFAACSLTVAAQVADVTYRLFRAATVREQVLEGGSRRIAYLEPTGLDKPRALN